MPARSLPDKFQVAFSFAGEQRDLVRPIAEAVEKELGEGQVFFDEWYRHYLPGGSADRKLQQIYGDRCWMAVVCVSGEYGRKAWTLIENEVIRSRWMEAQASADEKDRLAILPIRVGDGDVPGIHANTIAIDVRNLPVAEVAGDIVARLRLLVPPPSAAPAPVADWPDAPPALDWPMADQNEVRNAFGKLMTRDSPFQFLPVQGPSESGKTHITDLMYQNALKLEGVSCGRFDFKGTTGLENQVDSFVLHLEVEAPTRGRLTERLGAVLASVKRRGRPSLLIFDTYEQASGEEKDWMERQLLPSLIRASFLRVVVLGQHLVATERLTAGIAGPVLELRPPGAKDWYEFYQPKRADLTLAHLEILCLYTKGNAGFLRQLLDTGPVT